MKRPPSFLTLSSFGKNQSAGKGWRCGMMKMRVIHSKTGHLDLNKSLFIFIFQLLMPLNENDKWTGCGWEEIKKKKSTAMLTLFPSFYYYYGLHIQKSQKEHALILLEVRYKQNLFSCL